jgi:hypothetical protein
VKPLTFKDQELSRLQTSLADLLWPKTDVDAVLEMHRVALLVIDSKCRTGRDNSGRFRRFWRKGLEAFPKLGR